MKKIYLVLFALLISLTARSQIVTTMHGGTGIKAATRTALADSLIGVNTLPAATASVIADTVSVLFGGTGAKTLTAHGVVIGEGTANVGITAAGTAGQILTSGGASADPTYITLVPIANGGTNAATFSAAQTNLGFAAVRMAADSATTGQTLIGTPLQFTIGATDIWDFDIYINPTNSGTNGTKVGILLPTSASVQAFCLGNVATVVAFTTDIISASATAGANFNTSTATADVIWIHGTVAGGGTGGAVVLQFLATTSGTATIKAKSYLTAHRIS